ncbi:GDYXXLXY domain-containing protein [Desulfopila sp. IMCC35008]|uniref:GDYXXLXY domain-containing protein n=1 Tax=Desulfopila sp. IMCC35008 TaxID=2653858 RepID=UPI00197AF5C8|nr:GDYXXLXY domain-containing protein [Desulfopila sp. IMCC35008]
MFNKVALITMVIVLALMNWSIYKKEVQLASGTIVYLDLAPVDPRSLMQGDYMALRFSVANEVYNALPKMGEKRWRHDVKATDGYVVVELDERNIGSFKYIYNDQPLAENEILIQYRVRQGAVKFATNAFFFQEGHSDYYEPARYGQFRVDAKGEVLLVAMFDKDLKQVGPTKYNK